MRQSVKIFVTVQLCEENLRINVPVSSFKNFDPLNYTRNQKYKVKINGTYKDAVILYVASKFNLFTGIINLFFTPFSHCYFLRGICKLENIFHIDLELR